MRRVPHRVRLVDREIGNVLDAGPFRYPKADQSLLQLTRTDGIEQEELVDSLECASDRCRIEKIANSDFNFAGKGILSGWFARKNADFRAALEQFRDEERSDITCCACDENLNFVGLLMVSNVASNDCSNPPI